LSATRLLVLGVVRIFQPVHGYSVRRELLTWKVEEWAHVKPGSIYNALRTLTKEGYLEAAGTHTEGSRPERILYRLTLDGENEYFALLRAALWHVDHTDLSSLPAGLSFMLSLRRAEVIDAMDARAIALDNATRALDHAMRHLEESRTVPPHVAEHYRLSIARLGAERQFTRSLAERLRAGFYAFEGEPGAGAGPGPEGWPKALDTGLVKLE
jgi:DNA-binding PadR family transcriptional regulator